MRSAARASGCSRTARSTVAYDTPIAIPSRVSISGASQTGRTPVRIIAPTMERCALRGTRMVSPGSAAAINIVWTAPVVPFTIKYASSAPYARAASSSAARMQPVGAWKSSSSAESETSARSPSSVSSRRSSGCAPRPPLCPGV